MGCSVFRQASAGILFFLVLAMLPSFAPAQQAPASAPSVDCVTVLLPLLPCLPYVQGNVTAPAKNCCDALPGVVNSNPLCLCTLFGNNTLGIAVNFTDAANLPAACNVNAPPVSTCAVAGYPVPANLSSPGPSPVLSPPAPSPMSPPTAPPSMSPTSAPSISPASPSSSPSTAPVSSVSPASSSAPTPSTVSPAPMSNTPASSVTPSGVPSTGTTPGVSTSPPLPASPAPSGATSYAVSIVTSLLAITIASLRLF